jgi:hypothetical protein
MRYFKLPTIKAEMFKLELPKSAVVPAILTSVLGALGQVLIGSTHLFLIEQYVCREHYMMVEPARIWGDLIDESLCKQQEIQSAVAGIYGTYAFLMFMPGEYGIPMSDLADRIQHFFLLDHGGSSPKFWERRRSSS